MPNRHYAFERDIAADPEVARLMATMTLGVTEAEFQLEQDIASLFAPAQKFHLACALALLSRVNALQGKLEIADDFAKRARALFREESAISGEALVLHSRAIRNLVSGRQGLALEELSSALTIARGSNWPDLQACVLNMLGVVLNDMGRHEQARHVLREALGLPSSCLSTALRHRIESNLVLALARMALRAKEMRQEDWRELSDEAVQLARQVWQYGDAFLPADRPAFLDTLATALIAQGSLDEAHRALNLAESAFPVHRNDIGALYTSLTRARAWLEGNEPLKALGALTLGRRVAKRTSATILLDELELLSSRAYEQLGDYESALAAHKAFFRWRERQVHTLAEERARSLAVTLDFDRINRESRLDSLTGLLNRRGLQEVFERVIQRACPAIIVGLALIDLDHFKQVNDQFGHAAGDEALQVLAKILASECRPADFSARLGGDEFVLVVQGEHGTAQAVCKRVLQRLKASSPVDRGDGPGLTISAGVTETDQPVDLSDLMERADKVLYKVKRAGRGDVRSEEMCDRAPEAEGKRSSKT